MERFGVRRVSAAAMVVIAIAVALTTVITSAWQRYLLWGLVVGVCTGAVSVPLAAIIANRWFFANRFREGFCRQPTRPVR